MSKLRILAAAGAAVGVGGVAAVALAPGASAPAAALASVPVAAAPAAQTCDDGAWHGVDGLRVEGRPDGLDAGNAGNTYVWHDSDGWHVRATDPAGKQAHYTGVITLSAGSFVDAHTVRFEKDDHVSISATTLRYSFETASGVDGVDFHVSACGGDRSHEVLTFSMRKNGSDDDARRIDIGDHKLHPDRSTWRAARDATA